MAKVVTSFFMALEWINESTMGCIRLKFKARVWPSQAGFPFAVQRELFCNHQPVYGIFDGEEMGWLVDDFVNGGTIIGRISRTHHHGRGWGSELDDVRHFPARHAGHGIVGQDEVVECGIETGESLTCGICAIHLISEVVEKQLGQK